MRSFSPRVTKLIFGALIVVCSALAAAGVLFATPQPAPATQPTSCPDAVPP
ncbi:hypothetical protein [Nonomuraea rubra]|uniref:Uncharacterized protein n=1 Tax=Nonomuraea rubra TaxID=46180 RepID=A0A7X0P5E9_9ACTN|nr:hypothetical protein [Nonomuraea rubra]MBB6555596.1 hypothetical protein [Nonomuraea rubra]